MIMKENFKVMVFDEELDSLRYEKYIGIDPKDIETENGMYPLEDARKVYNESDGMIYYIFNLDLPAKVEASNLKQLRRSSALSNIFNYDVKKEFDIFKFLPWIVILAMIVFM